jgi:hypothetical protein
MESNDKQTAAVSGSDAPTCSLNAMEAGRRAVIKDQFYDALETIIPGETIELHHPEADGKPTNMGVVRYERKDGKTIRLYAACWGIPSEGVVAWSYYCMSIISENK